MTVTAYALNIKFRVHEINTEAFYFENEKREDASSTAENRHAQKSCKIDDKRIHPLTSCGSVLNCQRKLVMLLYKLASHLHTHHYLVRLPLFQPIIFK